MLLAKNSSLLGYGAIFCACRVRGSRLGGALFCDRRYGRVFVCHNGAESYYAARGFRGKLRA